MYKMFGPRNVVNVEFSIDRIESLENRAKTGYLK